MNLWHFTCEHGYAGIGQRGELRPNAHPWMPVLGPVIWLTSNPAPARDDVGLTRGTVIRCDRMAYRYKVIESDAVPWATARLLIEPSLRADLESFADPSTWWVAMRATARLA